MPRRDDHTRCGRVNDCILEVEADGSQRIIWPCGAIAVLYGHKRRTWTAAELAELHPEAIRRRPPRPLPVSIAASKRGWRTRKLAEVARRLASRGPD